MNSILDVRSITKRFGRRRVLQGACARFPRGSITALLGANGAGKSTFLRLALGTLKPDDGAVRVCGLDPTTRAARERIGYVPDRPDVYAWMTPKELFAFVAPQYARWDAEICRRASDRLALPLDTPFRKLSKGEGVKAMLVAALAQRPELLLLDEPFGGLDPRSREALTRAFLAELRPEHGAVVVATHELEIAARLADRVAMLQDGRIVREGGVAELLGGEDDELDRVPARLRDLYDAPERETSEAMA